MPEWLLTKDMWHDIFALGAPLIAKVVRPVIVYFVLVVLLRIFGKRELAQLNPFDLVVLLSLSNTVQNAIIGNDNSLTGGVIGAVTLLGINYLVVRYLFRHRRLDQWFEGKPTVLVENGKIVKGALAKELLTHAELVTVLHRQGFSSLGEVDRCVLEPGGTFFIKRIDPPVQEIQHQELLRRLDAIDTRLARLAGESGNA
jgi:uncharacterized membrane protein YcaP (DUF421 family)